MKSASKHQLCAKITYKPLKAVFAVSFKNQNTFVNFQNINSKQGDLKTQKILYEIESGKLYLLGVCKKKNDIKPSL